MTEVLDVDLARQGDDQAFNRLVRPLRGELHAHCYRMLGSGYDADDALQEALLRAWRGLDRFEGRSSLRSWLYTVATRTCLDAVSSRSRRALPVDLGPASDRAVVNDRPLQDVDWLGPYPDEQVTRRETVELAFVAALQHLPGNQRAALVLFEVLGFSAAEIAEMMDTTAASVNSALQRARKIVAEKVPPVTQQQTLQKTGDRALQVIVRRFATALQDGDAQGLIALLTEDVTWSMPPLAGWYRGIDPVTDFAVQVPLGSCGSWRSRSITANGQPAIALYLRGDDDAEHVAWSITVLTVRDGRIADLTSFLGQEHFAPFGLPLSLA